MLKEIAGTRAYNILKKRKMETVEDVCQLFPSKYYDFSFINPLNTSRLDKNYAFVCKLVSYELKKQSSIYIVRCTLQDIYTQNELCVSWFGTTEMYNVLKKDYRPGDTCFIGGKLKASNKKNLFFMSNPIIFKKYDGESDCHIYTAYEKIRGISESNFERIINECLEHATIPDKVPRELLHKYNLIPKDEAIREMHKPSSVEQIKRAKYRLNMDDLLYFALQLEEKNRNLPAGSVYGIHSLATTTKIIENLPFQLMNVSFKADYLFSGYKAYVRKTKVGRKVETYHTTEPYVEVVRIRPGKPDVSKGSKKKDKGVMTCLELYCMLMYAKEVAETMAFLRDEKVINVEASYYYLRRNGDKVEDIREDDFFDNKSKNVLTLSDVYYTADPNRKTEVDANFKKEFLEFFQSQECDPESCEHCTLNAVCNFTKPPEYIEKELTQKSLDSISLTEAQEKVIGFRKGFARVNAGAGAGKTMCVALRTAFLLSEGVDPAKICLLTFTNTGAAEMKERIGLYCEDFGLNINLDTLTVTTFNSFGDKIIHKNYEELGFEKEPRLIDDIKQSKIVAEMLKDNVVADLDYRNFNMNMPFVKGALPTAKKAFEIIKRENLSNESDVDVLWEKMKNESYDIAKTAAAALIELYGEYDDQLRERSLIEYADQELLIFELLKKNPFYFEDYGFEHIIVDEFQDTSQLQFEILKNIINSSLEFKSFLVVGDDSQSIFGFRGSNPQFIIEFEEKLGERVQDFYLLENHRSTKSIIDFANKINSLNKNRVVKDLIPTREKGESVIVEAFEKKNEEEDHIVSIIKEKIDEGHPLEDIAYIASTRSQLLKMGTRLTEEGIQWIMLNPEPMFSNSRIEGALSLARYLADNTATKDLFVYLNAVNNSEILEKKTDEEILSFIEKQKTALSSFYSDVDDAVKRNWLINYLEYLKGHKEVSDEVYEAFLKKVLVWDTYEEMLEYMLDFGVYGEREAAKRCKDYPGVVLTTAHSSKGMEWPIVIDEISKYHDKNLRDEKDIEEKRRLFFVSATRARDELYVVAQRYAYGSKGNGKSIPDTRVQNIFLREAVWAVEQK